MAFPLSDLMLLLLLLLSQKGLAMPNFHLTEPFHPTIKS
jgi:hypothetical protein